MGRVIVACLCRHVPMCNVTVADRLPPAAALPARTRFARVDLRDHRALVRLLRRHALVINSTSHHFNLPVMRAALDARVHYLDLGGLFHYTRRQLKLDPEFRKGGRTAILGMGCAPGISNLLALWAAEGMDCVEAVHIKVGGRSWGPSSEAFPYAVGTIREELMLKPAVYHGWAWRFARPRHGVEWFRFPQPVGRQRIFFTLHSEVATLPLSLPGVREASFKIGFPDEIIRAALSSSRSGAPGAPNGAAKPNPPRDCEITVALVRGKANGKRLARMACCKAFSEGSHAAGDWDTAWPPAIVAAMVVAGRIQQPGVFPPERIVPLVPFLAALRRVGFELLCRRE